MNIVFFSDKNYEYQIKSLIKSIEIHNVKNLKFIYFTIGFDSEMEREDLIKRRLESNPKKPRFEFYKPEIVLEVSREFEGHSIFFDSDVIVGRRFNPDLLKTDTNYPVMSIGNWDTPIGFVSKDLQSEFPVFKLDDRIALKDYRETGNVCEIDSITQTYSIKNEKGIFLNIKQNEVEPHLILDHTRVMDYYGVSKQLMTYVSSCFFSFNNQCEDFFLEWKSWTENPYFIEKRGFYLPFHDETTVNALLWKRGVEKNLGRIFVNTLNSKAAIEVETRDDIYWQNIFGDPNQFCSDSNCIQFYHGIKDPIEIENFISFLEGSGFNIKKT